MEFQRPGYTITGDHLAQHRELSMTAIGLGVHILSLPEGSRVDIRTLANRFPEGRQRIAAGLRELEKHGYLKRVAKRLEDGRMVTVTISYNNPAATKERLAGEAKPVERAARPKPAPERKPASPPTPEPTAPGLAPFQTCDGCERAFRAREAGLCRDCREGRRRLDPPAAAGATGSLVGHVP
ncbi:helix-turn-helix domain-containing protein [Streptomyces noursei]|uniref:helix-turn-helix domain-containing protein n=1 Tax=Streptomyces noursei TaxID=1971 RepID=UPI0038163517